MGAGFNGGTLQFIKPFPQDHRVLLCLLCIKSILLLSGAQMSCFSREGALNNLQPKSAICESEWDTFLRRAHQFIGIYETC